MSQNTQNNTVHLHHGRFGLSLLNSMIGEYLDKENNPLAVQMGFYNGAHRLQLDAPLTSQFECHLSNKVVVFVHGLANLENTWDYPPDDGSTKAILNHYIDAYLDSTPQKDQNYGTKLQKDHGFTPLFLRYNTGLSLEKSGRNFSKLLTELIDSYPIKIDELVLVGYGMGGRLLGHAQFEGQKNQAPWLSALSRCLYLGNINEGSLISLLMRLGGMLLRELPIAYSHTLANWLDRRSKQIQEQNADTIRAQAQKSEANPNCVYLENKQHFFIGGDLKRDNQDSEVTKNVFMPRSAPTHSQTAYLEGVATIKLTHSDKVYALLSSWVSGEGHPRIEVQSYPPQLTFPLEQIMPDEPAANDAVNRIYIAGAVDLVASAYDRTLETIETMHYSIAEEPFYAVEGVPIVSQIAKPVEMAQREMLDNLYRSLRKRGKEMHQFAADIA